MSEKQIENKEEETSKNKRPPIDNILDTPQPPPNTSEDKNNSSISQKQINQEEEDEENIGDLSKVILYLLPFILVFPVWIVHYYYGTFHSSIGYIALGFFLYSYYLISKSVCWIMNRYGLRDKILLAINKPLLSAKKSIQKSVNSLISQFSTDNQECIDKDQDALKQRVKKKRRNVGIILAVVFLFVYLILMQYTQVQIYEQNKRVQMRNQQLFDSIQQDMQEIKKDIRKLNAQLQQQKYIKFPHHTQQQMGYQNIQKNQQKSSRIEQYMDDVKHKLQKWVY